MTPEEAGQVIQDQLDARIMLKLKPITGLEFALAHIINVLTHRGVLTAQDALQSIQATREGLPPKITPEVGIVLRQPEGMLKMSARPTDPAILRSEFRVVQGGSGDETPDQPDR